MGDPLEITAVTNVPGKHTKGTLVYICVSIMFASLLFAAKLLFVQDIGCQKSKDSILRGSTVLLHRWTA